MRFLSWLWPKQKPTHKLEITALNIQAITAPILMEIIDAYQEAGKLVGLQRRWVALSSDETGLVVRLDFTIHEAPVCHEIFLPIVDVVAGRKGAVDAMLNRFKDELERDAEQIHP